MSNIISYWFQTSFEMAWIFVTSWTVDFTLQGLSLHACQNESLEDQQQMKTLLQLLFTLFYWESNIILGILESTFMIKQEFRV